MGKKSLLFATLLAWLAPMETGAGSTCLIGNVFVCCAGYYYNTNSVCTICPAGKACPGGLSSYSAPTSCLNGTVAPTAGMSACVPTTVCSARQYETVSATASRDRACANYTVCPEGQWKSGWSGTADGTCTPCATCETGFSVVQLCTQFQNRVCAHTVCDASTDCGRLFCNYSIALSGCNLLWMTGGISTDALCARSTITGVCTSCPVGWTAAGGYCAPCPLGASCDLFGVARPDCGGTCTAGKQTRCNAVTGRVDCSAACPVNATAAAAGHYQVYRGGVIDQPALCDAYFKCDVGYYPSSTALDAQGMSYPQCLPCQTPFTSQTPYVAVSAGMSYGDPYSCLYRSVVAYPGSNPAGQYGAAPFAPCPSGTTSEAGMAPNVTGCLACRLVPDRATVDRLSTTCSPVCAAGSALLGQACVDPASVPCTGPGYFLGAQTSQGQVCEVSPLPWNGVGNQSTGQLWVSRQDLGMRVVAYDPAGAVGTNGTQVFIGPGWTPLCTQLKAYPAYVQDVPLSAQGCDQIEYHRFYMVQQAAGMTLGFLERSFGFSHRFVLWGMALEGSGFPVGSILMRWMLPGRVCSAATSEVGGAQYLYMSFCNTSFVSFIRIERSQGWIVKDIKADILTTLGFNATVLIGGQTPGKADGLRDAARFGSSLSLAVGSDPTRLFVADRDNCRIAEVWIDVPGSFMTSARTVRASCYDPVNAIPSPRLLTSVLGGGFLLFVTDTGLVQMDLALRSFVLIADADLLPADPLALGADADHIWVWNATTNTSIRDDQVPCAVLSSSVPGRACTPCASGQYTPPASQVCTGCSSVGQVSQVCTDCSTVSQVCTDCSLVASCPAGTVLQPCNATHDASCAPCGQPPGYPFRYTSGCSTEMLPPCQVGWYGQSVCSPCPVHSTTPAVGAAAVTGCVCQYGGAMDTTSHTCSTPSPFAGAQSPTYGIAQLPAWLEPLGCRNISGTACGQCQGSIDSSCLPCGANGMYLERVAPRACLRCPAGTVGLNGLWCQACPPRQVPNAQGTACLCQANAVVGPDGVSCVCAAGHEEQAGACAPCPLGFASPGAGQPCVRCEAGSDSPAGGSECTPCGAGLYQDGVTTLGCTPCPGADAYALDGTSGDSCRTCNSTCPGGTSPAPCAGEGYACLPCEKTLDPATQHWITGEGYPSCLWGCNAGLYLASDAGLHLTSDTCTACTPLTSCPTGFVLQPCTPYADANCDTPCQNDTKPMDFAVWEGGCSWACEDGYALVRKAFQGWTEYACERTDSKKWMSWFFY